MDKNNRVTVYRYKYWRADSEQHRESTLYATREMIANGLGTPIPESGVMVPLSELKDGGIYIPGAAKAQSS